MGLSLELGNIGMKVNGPRIAAHPATKQNLITKKNIAEAFTVVRNALPAVGVSTKHSTTDANDAESDRKNDPGVEQYPAISTTSIGYEKHPVISA
jgi:hypothetical protein